jgi:hypothetical protein
MRRILTLVLFAGVTVALPAGAQEPAGQAEPEAPAPSTASSAVTGTGAALAPQRSNGLANIHGALKAEGPRVAGQSRDVALSAPSAAVPAKPTRPLPTPRALRKMGTERAVAAIDPSVRACAKESTVVSPTTFGLRVSVTPTGEVEGAELASSTRVPPALLACVISAVAAARFGAPGASGASVVVPITVPGRAAPLPTAAPSASSLVSVIVTPPLGAAPATPAPDGPAQRQVGTTTTSEKSGLP